MEERVRRRERTRIWNAVLVSVSMLALMLSWLFVSVSIASAAGTVWYVDSATGQDEGVNDCLTDSTPCQTIAWTLANKATDGDTILILSGTHTETVTLDGSVPDHLTLRGEGPDATMMDGEGSHRSFTIGADLHVTIADMTIQNGSATQGGAIRNSGTLTLTGSLVSDSTATEGGGVYNQGTLYVEQTTIGENEAESGGGLFSTHYASLRQSTVASNTASLNGGGIANSNALLEVVNVTISGNEADGNGGGLSNDAGVFSLHSSTIANNTADEGGGINNQDDDSSVYGSVYSSSTMQNTILANNTATTSGPNCQALGANAITSRGHNLIGNNESCGEFSAPLTNDLVGTPTGPIAPLIGLLQDHGGATWTHDLLSDSPAVDQGSCDNGPSTDQRRFSRPQDEFTIDAATDGDHCDIGAFEVVVPVAEDDEEATTPGATLSIDVVKAGAEEGTPGKDVHPDSANRHIEAHTVMLVGPIGLTKGPVDFDRGRATVNADGTITYESYYFDTKGEIIVDTFSYVVYDDRGWSSNEATVSVTFNIPCTTDELITAIEAANEDSDHNTITLANESEGSTCSYELSEVYDYPTEKYGSSGSLTLPSGYTAGSPSPEGSSGLPDIIYPLTIKTLELDNSDDAVTINRASGADSFRIFNVVSSGGLELYNLTISNGAAPSDGNSGNGGALYTTRPITLTGTVVEASTASGDGGGLFLEGADSSLLTRRIAIDYHWPKKDYARNTGFADNRADGSGGGIFNASDGGVLDLNRTNITDNEAGSNGGGLSNAGGELSMSSVTMDGNWSSTSGGALYHSSSELLSIRYSRLRSNGYDDSGITRTQDGGAVYATGGDVEIEGCTIGGSSSDDGNRATRSGGGIYNDGGDLFVYDTTIRYNGKDGGGDAETQNGGGVYHTGGLLTLDQWGTQVRDNAATGMGGGVYHSGGDLAMTRGGTIRDNEADSGGGLYLDLSSGSEVQIIRATIRDNTASGTSGEGGGVYQDGGSLTLDRVSLRTNDATSGGGLFLASGSTLLDRTTVRENYTTQNGGGLYNGGGAMVLDTSTVSTNGIDGDGVTQTSNGGGLYNASGGTLSVSNSTVTANDAATGPGLHNASGGTVEYFSSIISGNPDDTTTADCSGTGTTMSQGYNVVGSGCDASGTADSQDDTPLLGELSDNGGSVQTHMPIFDDNSPVINMGSCRSRPFADISSSTDEDQRGSPRPIAPKDTAGLTPADDWCDVGAVEGILFIVNDDGDATSSDTGIVTLREAIEGANNYESTDVIEFEIPTDGPHTIEVGSETSGEPLPDIVEPIVIKGYSQDPGGTCANTPVGHDLMITLDGTNTSSGSDGLHITAGESTIRGLEITGFQGDGIELEGEGDNDIRCNWLTNNLGNGLNITSGSSNNHINYSWDINGRNSISGNAEHGINVASGTHNQFAMNDILDNTLLGIDLGSDDITRNDSGDSDSGANNLQNYPLITSQPDSVDASGPQWTTISGELYSQANTTYRVELFTNATCDPSGNGEGQSYKRSQNVRTGGDGVGTFSFDYTPLDDEPDEPYVTLTATDNRGNTSEFSLCSLYNATVSGKIWLDQDRDGLSTGEDNQDPWSGEDIVATVQLYTSRGHFVASTETDPATGEYTFENVGNGEFYVQFNLPTGYRFTTQDAGSDDTIDSDADPDTGRTESFWLDNGDTLEDVAAGFKATGVTVEASDGSTSPPEVTISEDGETDSYTVRLNGPPDEPVTLNIVPDPSQVSVNPTTGVFTPDAWDTEVSVNVTAVDDDLVEDPIHTSIITNELTSDDSDFAETVLVNADIFDNDTPGVAIDPAEIDVYEGAEAGEFTVVLVGQESERPTENVTVTFDQDSELDIVPQEIVFTPDNWKVPRPVQVTALEDDLLEGDELHIIQLTMTSDDASYNLGVVDTTELLVTIHDTLVRIEPLQLTLTEGVGSATYEVRLTQQPTSTVTVQIMSGVQVTTDKTLLTFDTNNYDVPRTVTVRAVADGIAETPQHVGRIKHSVSSAAGVGMYDGLDLPDVEVTINDIDSPGVNISAEALEVAEEGPTRDTYEVWLNTKPVADVTVSLATPDGQTTVFPAELVFTPDNWDDRVQVTVEAVDDNVAEQAKHPGKIEHTVTSDDADYDGYFLLDKEVTVIDNDVPNVLIEPNLLKVLEEGETTAEYYVGLTVKPDQDVTIAILPDPTGQITITPSTLEFKLENDDWMNRKTITVQAIDDTLKEDDADWVTVQHRVTSSGSYNGTDIEDVEVHIVNNDVIGVDIFPTELEIAEHSLIPETYEVQLNMQPTGSVTVSLGTDGKTTINKDMLTFTPDTWNTAKIIRVLPVDDFIAQPGGRYLSTITHTISASDDVSYTADLDIEPVLVTIIDNEHPGVEIEPTKLNVIEGEPGQEYTIRLTSQPIADVTVSLRALEDNVIITPNEWRFKASDWTTSTNKTITVRVPDNDIADGNRADVIRHATVSNDPAYNKLGDISDVVVSITDDEIPNLVVTPLEVSVSEEGETEATYEVALTAQPQDDVTVNLTPSVAGQVTVLPNTITFKPSEWPTPTARVITVQAIDDTLVELEHSVKIRHTTSTADPDDPYHNLPAKTVTVNIVDNEEAGLAISPALVHVSEAGTMAEYEVRLTYPPTDDVLVTLETDGQTTVVPKTLLFQAGDGAWSAPQVVQVRAVDDTAVEWTHEGIIRHFFISDDPVYNDGGFPPIQFATIDDNDYPAIEISPTSVAVTEGEKNDPGNPNELTGDSDTYIVTLTYTPTGEVTVDLSTDGQSVVVPSTLSWTPDTTEPNWWKVEKTVTVYSAYDSVAEGLHSSTISHDTSCPDCDPAEAYNNLDTAYVDVTITDDDSPGVSITKDGETISSDDVKLSVSEEGETTDTYFVRLTSEPTEVVTVTFSPDEEITVVPAFVTFDSTNWNDAREITVKAVDDSQGEAAQHIGIIQHELSSNDPLYDDATRQFAVARVQVSVSDNELAGVHVTPTSIEVTENGATAEYRVSLSAPPDASVTLFFEYRVGGLVKTIPSTMTWEYDPDNPDWWATEKVVTVEAIDDNIASGTSGETIRHYTESDDTRYARDSFVIDTVDVTINDDDSPGISIVPTSIFVAEGGNDDTYKVRLNSEPTDEVVLQITSEGQTNPVPSELTWTPDGTDQWWQTEKIVTVEAIDDDIAEGTHRGTLRHSVSSFDPGYNWDQFAIENVEATIEDNDSPGVTVDPVAVEVSEDGVTARYAIQLNTEPQADVVISVNPGSQITVRPTDKTFNRTNWDVPQYITVYAVDDSIVEGLHQGRITHSISSDDPFYTDTMIAINEVNVTIQDNDSAGVTINPTEGRVSEDGVTATYEVVLNSEPTSEVTIEIRSLFEQTMMTPTSLLFDATNWNVVRTVTVEAVDDLIAEGLHNGAIEHEVSSEDLFYQPDMFVIDQVNMTIEDNDTAGVTIVPTRVDVSEDGLAAEYRVKLNTEPQVGTSVVVSMLPDEQVTATPDSVSFDSTTWDTEQTITVAAVDDLIAEELHLGSIQHEVSSDDAFYQPDLFAIADVHATITDNDTAGVMIAPLTLDVAEEGETTATYSVTLTTIPTQTVSISMTLNEAQMTVTPDTLTFDPSSSAMTPQFVTVQAVDDRVAEGLHSTTIDHTITSDDANYNGTRFEPESVKVNIEDNETPGVTIDPTVIAVSEEGVTATYQVHLNTKPRDGTSVVVSMQPDEQVTATPDTATFDSTMWDVPQTVTVAAVDDLFDEGQHQGIIAHEVASDDPFYETGAITVARVNATITDNDTAGVMIAPLTLDVAEEGETTATYSVTLTTIPTQTVSISMTGDEAQVIITPTLLTFDPLDATQPVTTPQLVTVQAVDDLLPEGAHRTVISHTIMSEDMGYAGTQADSVHVNIEDNDGSGSLITVTPVTITLQENGPAVEYQVKLNVPPVDPVSVLVKPASDVPVVLASPSSTETLKLTFTADNWDTFQSVPVEAVNDYFYTGPRTRVISHELETTDRVYTNTEVASVTVRIEDDEEPITYLPIISMMSYYPDLVASLEIVPAQNSYTAQDSVQIQVTITNQGTSISSYFWVDFYVNPSEPPTTANIPWDSVSQQGIAWYVQEELLPGESITINSTAEDYFLVPENTRWDGTLPAGTTDLYVYVDSWNRSADAGQVVPEGSVYESDEGNNYVYLTIPAVP